MRPSRVRFLPFWVVVVVAAVFTVRSAAGDGIVFRYLPGHEDVSSTVVAENVESGQMLTATELPARGPAGWGLSAPYSAEFSAAGSVLRSATTATNDQPLGPKLTLETWIRPLDLDQTIYLVGNRVGSGDTDFLLGIKEAIPFVSLNVDGAEVRLEGSRPLQVRADYWLAAVIRYENGTLDVKLYVNGSLAGSTTTQLDVPSPFPIEAPYYVGTRAEVSGSDTLLTGTFTGHLFGAVVRDYVVSEEYLSSSVPLDGGTYFGLPAYHDAPPETFHVPMDQQIDSAPVAIRHRYFLPYVNDGYIPQGTASRTMVVDGDTTSLVYMSSYHRTRSGATHTQPSIIVEIDAATGHVRRAFRLTGVLDDSHVGGIAYAAGALFVSSAGYLERYPIPAYEPGVKYQDLQADAAGTISVPSKASFVSEYRDTLWVGDWRTPSDVEPYLYGHVLDETGRPIASNPVKYALPRSIQGVDFYESGGQVYVFMSRNRSSTEAELLRYRREQLSSDFVSEPDSVITMPHGIEDLSFLPDGTLWTNSESGADFYQKGSPGWSTFYPFIYSVPADALFPGASHTSLARDRFASSTALGVYPNPTTDSATIMLEQPAAQRTRVAVYDILGRLAANVFEGRLPQGTTRFALDAGSLSPGAYFIVVDAGGHRWVKSLHVLR